MSKTDTARVATDQALRLLELPPLEGLTESQARGFTCVWDGGEEPLTAATAVDLGPRRVKRLDGHFDWHPRSCPGHVGQAALLALAVHCMGGCVECGSRDQEGVAIPGACDTGLSLLLLHMRKGQS